MKKKNYYVFTTFHVGVSFGITVSLKTYVSSFVLMTNFNSFPCPRLLKITSGLSHFGLLQTKLNLTFKLVFAEAIEKAIME